MSTTQTVQKTPPEATDDVAALRHWFETGAARAWARIVRDLDLHSSAVLDGSAAPTTTTRSTS
jgi:hypothetical protein